jgi:hypothetical protein
VVTVLLKVSGKDRAIEKPQFSKIKDCYRN